VDARPALIVRFAQQCATLSLLASSFSTIFFSVTDIMVFNYSFVLYTALDPTKLNKPRQFSRSTATPKIVDNSLWTETPAERQQRLADEVMGKKRRVENADIDQAGDEEEGADGAKRRKREAELQRQVDEYTVRLSPTAFILLFLDVNNTLLAIAPRSVADRITHAGGGEAQERGAGGGSWDMGSLA
jgi:hypothetical protein